jgi:hypothetical protein
MARRRAGRRAAGARLGRGSTPPDPRIAGLAVFHPAAGPAEIGADEPPSSLGERALIVHDAKPLIEFWLSRGVTPPAIHDSAVAAYLLNSARLTYKLEQVCMDALNEYPPAADPARAFGVRAEFAWRYWGTRKPSSGPASSGRSTRRSSARSCRCWR